MAKHKPETTQYTPNRDDSTYQTGSARPQKENRGLIALLMILVIFLGGIASILGLLNIRLVQQLAANQPSVDQLPLYVDTNQENIPTANSDIYSAPTLPNAEDWELDLEQPDQTLLPAEEILQRNDPSLVTIHRADPVSEPVACGVIMDAAGFLITNAYPIFDSGHIYVTLADGRVFRATLVGADAFTDLAVLFIDADGLTEAQFAHSDTLAAGDVITFIGADRSACTGTIRTPTAHYGIGGDSLSLLETDLSQIAGPVFNACGQIVGYSSPFLADASWALAIPSDLVREVAEQIIQKGAIPGRPCLGAEVEQVQPLHQQYWQLPEGLRITRTFGANSKLQGLEPGDILVSLNGHTITDRASLCAVLRTLQAGQQVSATVVRDHETLNLTITIRNSGDVKE